MTYPHRMLDLYPYPWLNPIAYTAIYSQQYDMGLSEIGDTNMGYMGLRFTPKRETLNVNYKREHDDHFWNFDSLFSN